MSPILQCQVFWQSRACPILHLPWKPTVSTTPLLSALEGLSYIPWSRASPLYAWLQLLEKEGAVLPPPLGESKLASSHPVPWTDLLFFDFSHLWSLTVSAVYVQEQGMGGRFVPLQNGGSYTVPKSKFPSSDIWECIWGKGIVLSQRVLEWHHLL